MAWSKIDEGASYIPSGASSTTVTFNVALAQNDIVIAVFGDDDGLGVADFLSSGWSTLHSNAGVDPGRLVMYKRMGATPDTSFSFDQDGQVRTAYLWQVWRGADTTTAIDATATTATGASGLPDAPSYTPVTNGALVFAVGIQDDDDASSGLTAPTGYTNLLASDTGQASTTVGATVMIASKELATAAAENPAAFTGGSGNDAWAAITFALRPAASGAQSITGALFTNSQTFYGATVGRGAVNIDGALVTNAQTFYGATVAASYAITGAKFDNSQTFYAAAVTPGSVDIAGALYTNSQTFYVATVSQGGSAQDITAALFTNVQSFFEATVAVGAVNIDASLFTNEQVFFEASIDQPVTRSDRGDGVGSAVTSRRARLRRSSETRNANYLQAQEARAAPPVAVEAPEPPQPKRKRKAAPEPVQPEPQAQVIQSAPAPQPDYADRSAERAAIMALAAQEDDEDEIEVLMLLSAA